MTLLLLKNKIRNVRNLAAKFKPGQKVVAALFHAVILGFMLFLLALFYVVFSYLKNGAAGAGAIVYLLDQLFFLVFVIAILSSAISGLYTLFRGPEIDFLASLPIKSSTIFDYLLVQNTVLNSWPVVVIGLPVALGYALAMKLSVGVTAVLLVAPIPLILLAEALGVLVSLTLAGFFWRLRTRFAAGLVFVLAMGLAYYLANLITPSKFDRLITDTTAGRDLTFISSSRISRPFLPNVWLSRTYKFALAPDYGAMLFYLVVLAMAAAVALVIARRIGGRVHWPLWMSAQETPVRAAGRPPSGPAATPRRPFPRLLPGLRGALLERDYLVFSRNTNEVYQAFFILVLVLVFVFVVSKLPGLNLTSPLWRYRLVIFLFGAICYFLAMIANRFVFPSLSIEGRSFWILLSSPLNLRQLYWAKLLSSLAILSLLGGLLLLVSAYFYQIAATLAAMMLLWVLAAGATVTTIALGIGVLYPNFARRSPAELSSSLAGLLATILSLAYGGVLMLLLRPVAAGFYLSRPPAILLPTALNLLATAAIFLFMSGKSLKKLEDFRL